MYSAFCKDLTLLVVTLLHTFNLLRINSTFSIINMFLIVVLQTLLHKLYVRCVHDLSPYHISYAQPRDVQMTGVRWPTIVNLVGWLLIFLISHQLVSFHHSGGWNFEVSSRFFKILFTYNLALIFKLSLSERSLNKPQPPSCHFACYQKVK